MYISHSVTEGQRHNNPVNPRWNWATTCQWCHTGKAMSAHTHRQAAATSANKRVV